MQKEHKKKKTVEETEEKKKDIKDIEEEIVVNQEDEILAIKKQSEEYLDDLKRLQADFENYKKRQTESQKDLIKYASQNVILQIIPVVDNFHMSTDHIPADQKDNSWVTGIMYIQKQLETILTENGVEEIMVKVGDTFDPVYHEAIESHKCDCEDENCEEEKKYKNKIVKVVMKGYKLGEKIIRPARVIVE
jgi:molecular chaperone GrpE